MIRSDESSNLAEYEEVVIPSFARNTNIKQQWRKLIDGAATAQKKVIDTKKVQQELTTIKVVRWEARTRILLNGKSTIGTTTRLDLSSGSSRFVQIGLPEGSAA